MQIKITKIIIIRDMDLRSVISADSLVIYHAIVLIMGTMENVINVDKKVILRVIVQNMVTAVIIVVAENVLNVENLGILPRIVMIITTIIMRKNGA